MKTDNEPKSNAQGYDLIGDIHGHAHKLVRLLARLGYRKRNGCYQHPCRQAIFLGDFIDRGPQIPETLTVVRRMVEEGTARAVIGNHEYNALCYHTLNERGNYLRVHSQKNHRQHVETLRAFSTNPVGWQSHLAWLRTLPLYLELPGLRIVHACWDDQHIAALRGAAYLTEELLQESARKGSVGHEAVRVLLKGKEVPLPKGVTWVNKDGTLCRMIRVRWWMDGTGKTYRQITLPSIDALPGVAVSPRIRKSLTAYPPDGPPVFIGHYWLTGNDPRPLAPNVACLDYGVAGGGPLVAYRWDGERALVRSRFVSYKK